MLPISFIFSLIFFLVYKGVLTWQGKVWTLVTNFRHHRSLGSSEDEIKSESITLKAEDHEEWEKKIDDIRNHIINNVRAFALKKKEQKTNGNIIK